MTDKHDHPHRATELSWIALVCATLLVVVIALTTVISR